LAQLIAALMEFKRNNAFGATAFGAFGTFWLALGLTYYWQADSIVATDPLKHIGFAVVGFLIFSVYMMFGAMTINKALFVTFFFITLLFIGLIGAIFYGDLWADWMKFAGWAEIGVSISGFYGSAAMVLNSTTGYQVLPMGKPILTPKQLAVLEPKTK